MDLLLNPLTHDIVFDNSSTSVTKDITSALEQKLKIKLLTFMEEWFLDETYGVPYYQSIFGKGTNKTTIDIIFRRLIAEEEHVQEILDFNSTLTNTREYTLNFRVRDTSGNSTGVISI